VYLSNCLNHRLPQTGNASLQMLHRKKKELDEIQPQMLVFIFAALSDD
jgi:hypothetical protein